MDFNQIRYFLTLSETLNFTRAAEQCFVSQPALTQAIRRLEDELGGELVCRNGREISVTTLGKSLRRHFEQIDRSRQLVRATSKAVISGEIDELNIGIMCTIGPRVLARLLEDFQVQHPMVSFTLHDVTLDSIPNLLLSGELDGAFCGFHSLPHPELSYIDLFEEPMVVAFPKGHEFADMNVVPLRDIAKQSYVDRLHCEFRQDFIKFCADETIRLNVAYTSQREDWIQSMVRDGMGVTVIPRFSLLRPELEYRAIIEPTLSRRVEFATADQGVATAALDMFIKHVDNHDWSAEDHPLANLV